METIKTHYGVNTDTISVQYQVSKGYHFILWHLFWNVCAVYLDKNMIFSGGKRCCKLCNLPLLKVKGGRVEHRRSPFLPAVVRHRSSSLLSWQLSWPLHKKLRSTQLPFRHLKRVSEHNSGLPVVKESGQRKGQRCPQHEHHGTHLSTQVFVYFSRHCHDNKTRPKSCTKERVCHVIGYLLFLKSPGSCSLQVRITASWEKIRTINQRWHYRWRKHRAVLHYNG